MAQHSQYWSNTKIAEWIRGTKKPHALTSKGWSQWNRESKQAHPIRYWIAEEALDWLQDFVTWPVRKLYDIKYYVNNRWITHTHALTAHPRDIQPGNWCDVGNRFLPCLFNELVDFIEVEKAWSHIAWGNEETRSKYKPPFWASGWFRWRTWRCPEAGLDHLAWEITLTNVDYVDPGHKDYGKPTPQAERAKELLELYTWWTVTYRNRPDPYEASGWTAACEASRIANGGKLRWGGEKDPVLKKASDKAHKLLQKIETAYEKEDEEMMIRLIKARDSLWT
jgi:hypothetical protein